MLCSRCLLQNIHLLETEHLGLERFLSPEPHLKFQGSRPSGHWRHNLSIIVTLSAVSEPDRQPDFLWTLMKQTLGSTVLWFWFQSGFLFKRISLRKSGGKRFGSFGSVDQLTTKSFSDQNLLQWLTEMIGVNSIHSSGRMRSRSLGSVRSRQDSRESDAFRYPRAPRSRSLKPLAFPDLLGKSQDRQQHQKKPKKKVQPSGFEMQVQSLTNDTSE